MVHGLLKMLMQQQKASQRLTEIDELLLEKLERWDVLEQMSKGN